jgi:hypothetical protein
MALRYEAWDLPTSATFTRKIADLPVIVGTGSGTVVMNDGGRGQLSLPNDYPRLSEVISASDASLIRVMDGTTIVHEWVTQRAKIDVTDTGRVTISGPDVSYLLSKSIIYPFDYPDQPTYDQDWYWGDTTNLIENGSFEIGTNFVSNLGFEDGTVFPWYAGAVDGVSATLAINSVTVDTGTYSAESTPLLSEGGMSTQLTGLFPDQTYTVTVRVNGTVGKTLQVGVTGPESMGVGTGDRLLAFTGFYAGTFEVQKDGTGTGAFQTITFTFDTAPEQVNSQISVRDASATPAVFYVDDVTVTGYGAGMEPWTPSTVAGVTTFESSTDVTAQAGSFSGKVTAGDGHGIDQILSGPLPGVTYTTDVYIRNTSGSARWVLEVSDSRGVVIGQANVVTTTVFQLLRVTAEVPVESRWLQIRLYNFSGGTATAYVDSAITYRGQPAASPGAIIIELHEDAYLDHVSDPRGASLDWVDSSGFTAAVDTGGTAWSGVPFIARGGDTFLNMMRNWSRLKYEWRVTPKATVALPLTHDLEVYVETGMGTDYLSAATPSVQLGAGVSSADIIRRVPESSVVFVSGVEGAWDETQDATLVTNFGHWEGFFVYDSAHPTSGLSVVGDKLLNAQTFTVTSVEVDMFATPLHPRPLTDFTVGDLMKWQIAPHLPIEDRRVTRVAYKNTEPTSYTVVAVGFDAGKAEI